MCHRCAALSQMNNANFSRVSEQYVKDVAEYGAIHLILFGIVQDSNNGLYFLHEHPAYARGLQNEDVQRSMTRNGVGTVVGCDMCEDVWRGHALNR